MKGIKIQVFGQIEELEETKVQERGELVAELVPAMESRGYETVGRSQ